MDEIPCLYAFMSGKGRCWTPKVFELCEGDRMFSHGVVFPRAPWHGPSWLWRTFPPSSSLCPERLCPRNPQLGLLRDAHPSPLFCFLTLNPFGTISESQLLPGLHEGQGQAHLVCPSTRHGIRHGGHSKQNVRVNGRQTQPH